MTLPLAVSDHTYWWIALVIGLLAVNIFRPGVGLVLPPPSGAPGAACASTR